MDIYKKIVKVKQSIGKVSKDAYNPFHESQYFDINQLLEVLEPELQKNKLMLLQPIIDGAVVSKIIDLETGEGLVSSLDLPKLDNPQKIGSCITYYRRYTLQSLLSLQAEDDDGNAGAGLRVKKEKKPEPEKWLNITPKDSKVPTPEWTNVLKGIADGTIKSLNDVRGFYKVSKAVGAAIEKELKNR